MCTLAVLFGLIALATLAWLVVDYRGCRLELEPVGGSTESHGLVTIVVPMRDEIANIDRCLTALQAQTYPELEVIVVDDGSTDGTDHALRRWQKRWTALQVLTLDGRPQGWAGKAHALHHGVRQARGDWLLFIDADVELGQDTVSRAVATAHLRKWPVLSLIGRLRFESFWERVLLLYFWVGLYATLVNQPYSFLVGHFTLLRRSTYEAIGGFAAIPDAVSTDVRLAQLLVRHGARPRVRLWSEAYRCRMYRGFTEVWNGVARMQAAAYQFNPAALLAVALLFAVAVSAPQLVTVWWLLARQSTTIPATTAAAAAALALVQWFAVGAVMGRLSAPRRLALLMPLGNLAMVALLADTSRRLVGSGVSWRGRRYGGRRGTEPEDREQKPQSDPPDREPLHSLTVVVTRQGSLEAPSAIEDRLVARAINDPRLQVIVVQDSPAPGKSSHPETPQTLVVPGGSKWQMKRAGLEAARGRVVAFVDASFRYPTDWIDRVMAAFDKPTTRAVTGRARFEGGARAKALSIREWGHLAGTHATYPCADNFAGRRDLLLRTLPTGRCGHLAGELVCGSLTGIEHGPFDVLDGATGSTGSQVRDEGGVIDRMTTRLCLPTAVFCRALSWLEHRPLLLLPLRRLLPMAVWADNALLGSRAMVVSRASLGIHGTEVITVPCWLVALAIVDLVIAARAVLQPGWCVRRASGGFDPAEEARGTTDSCPTEARLWGIFRRLLITPRWRYPRTSR